MIREIKFRVWDIKEKRFDQDVDFDVNGKIQFYNANGKFHKVLRINQKRFIIYQFTGLKDKNGKKIYEGDIIERAGNNLVAQFTYGLEPNSKFWPKDGQKYVVVALAAGFTLIPDYSYNHPTISPNQFGNIDNYNFWNGSSTATKIIGNICENPNLINNI